MVRSQGQRPGDAGRWVWVWQTVPGGGRPWGKAEQRSWREPLRRGPIEKEQEGRRGGGGGGGWETRQGGQAGSRRRQEEKIRSRT